MRPRTQRAQIAWGTALTPTLPDNGDIAVGVQSPAAEIVPKFAAPPGTLFTSHLTVVFELPVTMA
jgi:hypothetical protein